jgi:hypothetical protein
VETIDVDTNSVVARRVFVFRVLAIMRRTFAAVEESGKANVLRIPHIVDVRGVIVKNP